MYLYVNYILRTREARNRASKFPKDVGKHLKPSIFLKLENCVYKTV